MVGKNAPFLRKKFEEISGKKALTPKGELSKIYQDWLTEDSTHCKPHWASTVKRFKEKILDIDAGKITGEDALKEARRMTQLSEQCSVEVGRRIADERAELEKKYNIKF